MKAIVIGATGLVGKSLVRQLLENENISEVFVFVRRETHISHPKLKEKIINFDDSKSWELEVVGDVLYSALGTTLKAAGSKEAQYKVDFDYQYNFARIAKYNGVKKMVLISSTGADATSRIFYLKMKGELEKKVKDLGFEQTSILRPGPLKGEREHPRFGEVISTNVLGILPKSRFFGKVLPVDGPVVARRAIELSFEKRLGLKILEASDILFN